MKIPVTCMQCGFPNDGSPPDFTIYGVPVRDDNIYELTCRRGHKTSTVVQEEKFEVLFEIAVNAIADGYYREAVASATSSLERFYEYFVRVYCEAHKVPESVFEDSWKHVRNHSERQLGMYVATYTLQFSAAPELVCNERANFRNEIIHKGRIPTRDEAIEYLNYLLGLAMPVLILIKQHLIDAARTLSMKRVTQRHSALMAGPRATASHSSPLSMTLALSEPHLTTIDARLKQIEQRRFRGYV